MTYQPNGNVASYQDSSNNAPIVGSWTYSYDSLNRLSGAQEQETPPVNPMTNYCWSYDAFGNRTSQDPATSPFQAGSGGASPCLPANPPPISYNTNNQINGGPEVAVYDAAGNITNDGTNQYLYNADGKICAVEWYDSQLHLTEMTGYIYDAEGNRVAKGAITTMSCDPSTNGFTTQADYVLDQAGHQLSEFRPGTGGAMVWQHTNVYASGELIATDDTTETHYYLNDWLGTRRVQTDYEGVVEQTCASLPYGDGETCAPTPTENLFTGKERDSESGNDYFGARYYASSMGRWMSPDWSRYPEAVPYVSLKAPQSLNLYSYVLNNPLRQKDPDGHHQECGSETISTNKNGDTVVNANCHDVPDWWQFQGARRWLGQHPKTVKVVGSAVIGTTAISGVLDGGASELAVPEEIALEEALIEGGEETAAEAAAEETAAETAGEPASEKQALRVAKQIERDLGKDARRDFHDEKMKGAGDRTMQQLKEDARAVYEDHGKTPPSWLK